MGGCLEVHFLTLLQWFCFFFSWINPLFGGLPGKLFCPINILGTCPGSREGQTLVASEQWVNLLWHLNEPFRLDALLLGLETSGEFSPGSEPLHLMLSSLYLWIALKKNFVVLCICVCECIKGLFVYVVWVLTVVHRLDFFGKQAILWDKDGPSPNAHLGDKRLFLLKLVSLGQY